MQTRVEPVRRRYHSDALAVDALAVVGYRARADNGWTGQVRKTVAEARGDGSAYREQAERLQLELGAVTPSGYCYACGASNCGQDCYECGAPQHPSRRRQAAA